MAKETINTLKIAEPDGGNPKGPCTHRHCAPSDGQKTPRDYRRSSTGSFNKSLSRKDSIGKPTPPSNGPSLRASISSCNDVVPNYLKPSSGSCHDLCKYGRHNSFEPKARIPVRQRVSKPASDLQSSIETDKVIKAAAKIKTSPDLKDVPLDLPVLSKNVPARQDSSTRKKTPQLVRNDNISGKGTSFKTRTATVKPSTSPGASLDFGGKRISEKRAEIAKAPVKKVLFPSKSSLSPSTNRAANLNVKRNTSLKLAAALKDQKLVSKPESVQPDREQIPEKTLQIIKKIETEHEVLESVEKNGIGLVSASSPTSSSPESSSVPTIPFPEEEVLEESETEYSYSEEEEEYDSLSKSSCEEVESGDPRRTEKRPPRDVTSNEDPESEKLKFQRGKVVDIEAESNGSRRLRFRRGRILGENQESKAGFQRRRYKKRAETEDTNDAKEGSEKVMLKHQDVQEKNAQGLFNNVIEETASKLVESRKSKVKALVGAFETVISLQESKPSTSG